jgi:hypothetical protein
MTSRNGGNGFSLPISMLLPPLAVVALRHYRAAVIPAVAALVALAVLNVTATSSLWDGLAKPHVVSVPGFGQQAWLNGTPRPVGALRAQVPGPSTRFVERDRGWPRADDELAQILLERIYSGELESGVVAFSSRHRAISSNSVELALLLHHSQSIPFTQLQAEPSDTVRTYTRQLTDPDFGSPGMLLTMNRNTDDFPPLVTQSIAETAARGAGFHRVQTMTLPDGRQLRLWVKGPAAAAKAESSSRTAGRSPAPAPGSPRG